MIDDTLKSRLDHLHEIENNLNRMISNIDKQIKSLRRQKVKYTRQVSHNMKFRNKLINENNTH